MQYFPLPFFQSGATRASKWNYLKKKGVSIGLTMYNQKIHITKTAGEFLFEGYDDPMMKIAKEMPLLDAKDIPFDKFGWFYMVSLVSKS